MKESQSLQIGLATRMGFEPTISALTGRCVKPDYTTGPQRLIIRNDIQLGKGR